MRRRIVLTTVAVSLISLLLFGFLVVWGAATRIVDTQKVTATVDADRIATGINARLAAGLPIEADALAGFVRSDESVEVRYDGRTLLLGKRTEGQRSEATSMIAGPST